jgi:glycosyltransferase involved in cell wall biosynthesis
MNILFINSIGKHKFGGGEKWMVKAAAGLAGAGHTVFIAGKRDSEILKDAEAAGVRIKAFNVHGDFSPISTLRIARFLKREAIDVLVCNLNKDVRVAGLAARLVRTPVVIARHGVQLCGKKARHRWTLTRLADGILTNTETIRSAYAEYGWFDDGFVRVVYNGVDDKSGVVPHDFSAEYPGKKIVFSAGRLSAQKGFHDLIEAARILFLKRNDLVFLAAGRGGLEASLKKRVEELGISDRFKFLGFVHNIDPLLKGCDLFVLASHFEGMPNAVMEAMAAGRAVVATDVNGARELMEDGKTGLIVPPKDPARLAEAVDLLIDDPALIRLFGKNGLERVRSRFTIPAMVGNLELYFSEKIAEHR